jgi:ubiquitin conjugation factor E4 A
MMPMQLTTVFCSDGFFLNLSSVLVRLCQPLSEPCSAKLLKLQPTYCQATAGTRDQRLARNVHMQGPRLFFYYCHIIGFSDGILGAFKHCKRCLIMCCVTDLAKETCLVPAPAGTEPQLEASYSFLTEVFFLAHDCLHIGFEVASDRFTRINQMLHRIQSIYQDIGRQGGEQSEVGLRIKDQMEKGIADTFHLTTLF